MRDPDAVFCTVVLGDLPPAVSGCLLKPQHLWLCCIPRQLCRWAGAASASAHKPLSEACMVQCKAEDRLCDQALTTVCPDEACSCCSHRAVCAPGCTSEKYSPPAAALSSAAEAASSAV